jgi:hypothetical protein
MADHIVSAVNPDLELAFDDIKRRHPLPLSVLEALDGRHMVEQRERSMNVHREALTRQVKPEFRQLALGLHAKLEAKAESIQTHARARKAIANRLLGDVAMYARGVDGVQGWARLVVMGVDSHEVFMADDLEDVEPVRRPFNRAGLAKLCPDDGRREGARIGEKYGRRLRMLDQMGYVLRYAVVSPPCDGEWALTSGLYDIHRRLYDTLFRATVDGKNDARNWKDPRRRFPDLVGALWTIEAPMSGRYDDDPRNAWHVHANVMLVFKPSSLQYGMPDYGPLREAIGCHIHFEEIKQDDHGGIDEALQELLKYPVQAISYKSAEHRKPRYDHEGNLLPPPKPMVEWSAERIYEFIEAHRNYRRTRSWGQLYDDNIEALDGSSFICQKPIPRNLDRCEWLGMIYTTPALVTIQRPMMDTRELDAARRRREHEHRARLSIDPEYAAEIRARELRYEVRAEHRRRRRAARDALFTFIQGHNFAGRHSMPIKELPRVARGPPDERVSAIAERVIEQSVT